MRAFPRAREISRIAVGGRAGGHSRGEGVGRQQADGQHQRHHRGKYTAQQLVSLVPCHFFFSDIQLTISNLYGKRAAGPPPRGPPSVSYRAGDINHVGYQGTFHTVGIG